ncbi:hypothetical protein GCM10022631_08600 [Deinococcus rubellus]|uniref:Uncharacterized protein n=1 Tax=Deinococcus rubellus TaxID=1889240 RepID=A0ABY5YHQ1_9DEIO|nr:hypothetical protein [Deinococcus rubellus]UWX64216.1 hypothetical protein N0D28_00625 [Deinococcus rubellus]
MNETLKTALATALTAATEAFDAAQQGQFTEARQLLTIVAEQLALGEGGNAAAAACRGKILRLEVETQTLLDAAPVDLEPANLPLPAPRKAAAPVYLTAEAWSRVRAALVALGVDPLKRDAVAAEQEQAAQAAAIGRNSYAVKVAQRLTLVARVEAAALRGEVDAANTAWDRLFDIVTALRISELNARRKNADEAERALKLANYTAAREDSLRIRQWARSVQAT